jgi:hypothetical protein
LGWVPDIVHSDEGWIIAPRPQGRLGDPFTPDMWVGEGGSLFSDRMKAIKKGVSLKKYHFQIRHSTNGRKHFRKVSIDYPALHFVLVEHWGPPDLCRSFLIHNGRTKAYVMSEKLMNSILIEYGCDPDLATDDDDEFEENDWKGWEASWGMMDRAEARWLDGLLQTMRATKRSSRDSGKSARTKKRRD